MKKRNYLQEAVTSCPNKPYPIKDIVYLDSNFRTFKYFLTGEFDENGPNEEPLTDQPFLRKLTNLNEKVKLFNEQFVETKRKKEFDRKRAVLAIHVQETIV